MGYWGSVPLSLAAAAVVIAATATAVTAVAAAQAVVATAAEQQDENDDPPAAVTTETIVTHNQYLRVFLSGDAAHSNIFPKRKMVQGHKKDQLISQLVFCFNATGRRGICQRQP